MIDPLTLGAMIAGRYILQKTSSNNSPTCNSCGCSLDGEYRYTTCCGVKSCIDCAPHLRSCPSCRKPLR